MSSAFTFLLQRWQLVTTLLGLVIGVAGLVIGVISILPEPPPHPCIQIMQDFAETDEELQTHARVVSALRSRMAIKDEAFQATQTRRNRIVSALRAHEIRQEVRRVVTILSEVDEAFRERFEGHHQIYDIHDSTQMEFFAELLQQADYPAYEERLALRQSMDRMGFEAHSLGMFVAGGRLFDTSVRTGLIEGFQAAIATLTEDESTLQDLGYDLARLRSTIGEDEADALRRSMDAIRDDYRELSTQLTEAAALEDDAAIRLQALEEQMQQHDCASEGT